MASAELSYRIREATIEDLPSLRTIATSTLSHPDGKGRRDSYRAAALKSELLLLERYDVKVKDWRIGAFVDWHMRVDDVLTIRDAGTEGETPHSGMVKQLIMELIRSLSPTEAGLKTRADVEAWNEIVRSIAGFTLEGSEYRRPHWINIWKWTPEEAARLTRGVRPTRFRR